jgi:hypothetical protein
VAVSVLTFTSILALVPTGFTASEGVSVVRPAVATLRRPQAQVVMPQTRLVSLTTAQKAALFQQAGLSVTARGAPSAFTLTARRPYVGPHGFLIYQRIMVDSGANTIRLEGGKEALRLVFAVSKPNSLILLVLSGTWSGSSGRVGLSEVQAGEMGPDAHTVGVHKNGTVHVPFILQCNAATYWTWISIGPQPPATEFQLGTSFAIQQAEISTYDPGGSR